MAEVTWPDKMITQAEAFAKAADWPVRAEIVWHMTELPPGSHPTFTINLPLPPDSGPGVVLRCAKEKPGGGVCGQSCGQLARGSVAYNGSLDEMLSMVLRHMVMAHDVPLNTRPRPATAVPDVDQQVVVASNIRPERQDNGPSDGSTP